MSKFVVLPCSNIEDDKSIDYDGHVVALASSSDVDLMVFFPVSMENARLINYVLEDENPYDINTDVLGVYQTMLDSWISGDSFLSGIIMDTIYSEEIEDNVVSVRLLLSSNRTGRIEGLVRVNFIHSIILAAMEKVEIIIDDDLLDRLIPGRSKDMEEYLEDDEDDEEMEDEELPEMPPEKKDKNSVRKDAYPVDQNLIETARRIIGGKLRDEDDEAKK